ncbi:acetate kinase [Odoribacter sp. OttesenSCG-928-J03]|nr:acetate kinase [Odoribacter sp. OttesenSCG-928-J03]MDL2330643.1 acetate kinase [Odoribacter sp. OttesenSCG-928-A06]
MNVLVLNCGSSSIKYQLLEMSEQPVVVAKGLVEKIGLPVGAFTHKPTGKDKVAIEEPISDHTVGINLILKALTDSKNGVIRSLDEINAVGHRIAHGGEYFTQSTLIDAEVIEKIKRCCELAPLHNPAHLKGIETIQNLLPKVPQVAVFDTSFHQTLPAKAYTYGIPYDYYKKYSVRRYGFHGTSHKYVAEKACGILGWNINEKKIITCHLGNGASITAINKGKSVDTSMGFTPVAGLVMGTRCGDLDVGALLYICDKEGLDLNQANDLINKKSGVNGVSGISSDFRELESALEKNDDRAKLALEVFCYNVKKYIGAYAAVLNGVDLIIFTGGIGENDDIVRQWVCEDLSYLGVHFNSELNSKTRGSDTILSTDKASTTVMTVTTDEELVIAMDTVSLVK